jgi:hypothetical protein
MQSKHLNDYRKTPSAPPNQPTDMDWRTSASLSQSKLSRENTGQMSKEYQRMKRSCDIEDNSLLNSFDPLSILAQTDRLCLGLGDTLVCLLCAASK